MALKVIRCIDKIGPSHDNLASRAMTINLNSHALSPIHLWVIFQIVQLFQLFSSYVVDVTHDPALRGLIDERKTVQRKHTKFVDGGPLAKVLSRTKIMLVKAAASSKRAIHKDRNLLTPKVMPHRVMVSLRCINHVVMMLKPQIV